jgi:hypothetical protein
MTNAFRAAISLLALASVAALAFAGCGGGSDSTTTGASTATSTSKAKTTTTAAKLSPAEEKQLEATRKKARPFAECLRAAGAKVSTEANDVKDQSIRTPDSVVLRLRWKGDKADIAVRGTAKDADALAAKVDKSRLLTDTTGVVIFDRPASSSVEAGVKKCFKVLDRAT